MLILYVVARSSMARLHVLEICQRCGLKGCSHHSEQSMNLECIVILDAQLSTTAKLGFKL
ncbi:hypothetical protein VCR4J5_670121 [Vibrio crassostreae]|uniref:Uncharacterized protein n=1 Tax=Vibrio crassostreae TaxID=246167 RepID=A0ABP1WXW9_9VIBR|nr:hypothetical protein VCR4J5_670121 [Vibrio crassostreae]